MVIYIYDFNSIGHLRARFFLFGNVASAVKKSIRRNRFYDILFEYFILLNNKIYP